MMQASSALDRLADSLAGRLEPFERFAKRYAIAAGALILVASLADAFVAYPQQDLSGALQSLFRSGATSVIVGLAATSVGALLGFLFGIPRSLQRLAVVTPSPAGHEQPSEPTTGAQPAAPPSRRPFASNTSLEEISDWLTKIIIGIGLVEFDKVLSYLARAANTAAAFAADTRASETPQVGAPLFYAIIILGLIGGCLFAYLETRTRLMTVLLGAETVLEKAGKLAEEAGRHPITTADTLSITAEDLLREAEEPKPRPEDYEVVKIERSELSTLEELLGWASAHARLGNFQVAEDALRDALQRDPANIGVASRIAEVRRLRRNYAGAAELVIELAEKSRDPAQTRDLLRRALYYYLYVTPPIGFQKALEVAKRLIDSGAQDDPTVQLWRAAALGQQYRWLQQASSAGSLDLVQDEALAAVRKVVELCRDPSSQHRVLLRRLLDPVVERSDPEENDLEPFKSVPEFRNAVLEGRTAPADATPAAPQPQAAG